MRGKGGKEKKIENDLKLMKGREKEEEENGMRKKNGREGAKERGKKEGREKRGEKVTSEGRYGNKSFSSD